MRFVGRTSPSTYLSVMASVVAILRCRVIKSSIAVGGGVAGYGADVDESLRRAGIYISRALKGENPAGLPVLQPTQFIFAINLATDL
jgi:hypothetical protein